MANQYQDKNNNLSSPSNKIDVNKDNRQRQDAPRQDAKRPDANRQER